jgi:hypothetical protein
MIRQSPYLIVALGTSKLYRATNSSRNLMKMMNLSSVDTTAATGPGSEAKNSASCAGSRDEVV